jgi:hypothetical protein
MVYTLIISHIMLFSIRNHAKMHLNTLQENICLPGICIYPPQKIVPCSILAHAGHPCGGLPWNSSPILCENCQFK